MKRVIIGGILFLWCCTLPSVTLAQLFQSPYQATQLSWLQVLQTGQAYEYQDRNAEAINSYIHARKVAITDEQRVTSLEHFGKLSVKLKRDSEALKAAQQIIRMQRENVWAREYLAASAQTIEADRSSRERSIKDINLVRATSRTALYGISTGDDWRTVQRKYNFRHKESGDCGGRAMLQTFTTTVSSRTLTVYVARDVVVRVDIAVPHSVANDRQAMMRLVEERHGAPLSRNGDFARYTPVVVSDISDVFLQVRPGFYDITVFNARAYVNIAQTMRSCATEEHVKAAVSAVLRYAASAPSSSGNNANSEKSGNQSGYYCYASSSDYIMAQKNPWGKSDGKASYEEAKNVALSNCRAAGGKNCQISNSQCGKR